MSGGAGEGMGIMETPEDYEKLKAYLYGDQLIGETDAMLAAFAGGRRSA